MNSLKSLKLILGKKVFLLMALIVVGVLVIVFTQKSCGGGYESPKYLELKGRLNAHTATAEQKEKQLKAMDKIVSEENASLRDQVDKLETEKGEILAESAEINKKIFEKDLELEDLKEKEKSFTGLSWELVNNLRSQITTLEDKFSLAIEDRDKARSAHAKAEKQIVDLNLIIDNKDILIGQLRVTLAAEIVARKAAEAAMSVGEKNNFLLKGLRLVGNGFKIYGMYSAGKDILKGAKT